MVTDSFLVKGNGKHQQLYLQLEHGGTHTMYAHTNTGIYINIYPETENPFRQREDTMDYSIDMEMFVSLAIYLQKKYSFMYPEHKMTVLSRLSSSKDSKNNKSILYRKEFLELPSTGFFPVRRDKVIMCTKKYYKSHLKEANLVTLNLIDKSMSYLTDIEGWPIEQYMSIASDILEDNPDLRPVELLFCKDEVSAVDKYDYLQEYYEELY